MGKAMAVGVGFLALGAAAATTPFGRMDTTKLNIGAYCLATNAQTEAHVRDIAACGIDFMESVPYDLKLMDLFAKYKLGAIVTRVAPPWWGGDGSRAGAMATNCPLSRYEKAAAEFRDHPAIWGIDVGDEPSALDFPHYGKVIDFVNRAFPNQFAYLNLYPNYASVARNTGAQVRNQLGTRTYDEHIAAYVKNVNTPYICYDFYVYSLKDASPDGRKRMFANFKTVSDACRATGRKFWYVLQVNGKYKGEPLTENQLRYQANLALAYGAETLLWACWTKGWWDNNVLDAKGNRTAQYAKLRKVNGELHRLGGTYMKYRTARTRFTGDFGTDVGSAVSVDWGAAGQIKAADDAALALGLMDARDGKGGKAFLAMAADDPCDERPAAHLVTFACDGPVKVTGANGEIPVSRTAGGALAFPLASGQAAVVELLPKRRLVWADEFDGAALDSARWSRCEKGTSDWDRHMSPRADLVQVKDGMLVMTGVANADTNADPRPFLTGGVSSRGKGLMGFGKVEIRAKFENQKGAWPALWMCANGPDAQGRGWPWNGEIDIVERLNGDAFVYQTAHSGWTVKKGGRLPPNGGQAAIRSGEWNVYGLERTPDALIWSVNGGETFRYRRVPGGDPDQWPFDGRKFFFFLDMQLGGDWAGKVDASTLPVKMYVDWIRVWE